MLNIVDFPTPFGPSTPQISPSLTVNEMSSSICLLLNGNINIKMFEEEKKIKILKK